MFKTVTGKLGNMRKEQSFSVLTGKDNTAIVQSTKSIGMFNLDTRYGKLNTKGSTFVHLTALTGAIDYTFPIDFVDAVRAVMGAPSDRVILVGKSDNNLIMCDCCMKEFKEEETEVYAGLDMCLECAKVERAADFEILDAGDFDYDWRADQNEQPRDSVIYTDEMFERDVLEEYCFRLPYSEKYLVGGQGEMDLSRHCTREIAAIVANYIACQCGYSARKVGADQLRVYVDGRGYLLTYTGSELTHVQRIKED